MASVVFLLEHEEGHLLPTFQLAKRLTTRGHQVSYIGLADAAELVERQGYPFSPIMENVFPKGSTRTLRDKIEAAEGGEAARNLGYSDETVADLFIGSLVRGEDVAAAIRTRQPDVLLISSLYPPSALVMHYRFRIPILLITPWLRPFPKTEYVKFIEMSLAHLRGAAPDLVDLVQKTEPTAKRFQDIARPFLAMRELILCPAELDLPRPEWGPEHEVFHIEPSIELSRGREDSFPWERLLPGRPLLYASLGSHSHEAGREKLAAFYTAVAEAAGQLPEWQLVLATGAVEPREITNLPETAIAARWVPQIPVLEKASVMITHGGLGTVKECIFHGVPMVAFPLDKDQPENARRIVHHGLGLSGGGIADASAVQIVPLVRLVHEDPGFARRVRRMRNRFREVEESGIGVRLIEEMLPVGTSARSGSGFAKPAVG
jgi:zeaxanthin glucosyltransferase